METSSSLYKVYMAKRLLQNKAIHGLIGEKKGKNKAVEEDEQEF